MLRDIKAPQRLLRDVLIKVDGTGTASITKGSQHATLVDNGTGDYSLTLTKPGAVLWGVSAIPIGVSAKPEVHSSSTGATVRLVFTDGADSAVDVDFYARILVSDAEQEY